MGQISFVLPFTICETVTEDLSWRNCVNSGALLRLAVLLHSFVNKFFQDDLNAFLVVCPANQCGRVKDLIKSITCDIRYQVVSEESWISSLVPTTADNLQIAGWYRQQILKMAASLHVSTLFYVSLDSDIVCIRDFSADDIIYSDLLEKKQIVALETELDYSHLYHKSYATLELSTKARRYACSAGLLKYERVPKYKNQFYGETPCVINAAKMGELLKYLETSSQRSWHDLLASGRGWTEYSLYFQYLEMTDSLERTCSISNCNALLDLERSVWQDSNWYRTERLYNKEHFVSSCGTTQRGPFVAIQSWLPRDAWLPSTYKSLVDFYRDLLSWITVT